MQHNPAFSFDFGCAQFWHGCDEETAARLASVGGHIDDATADFGYARAEATFEEWAERSYLAAAEGELVPVC
ncbi:MAG: hypothetical protein GX856_13945 [Gammaproteobacteria bacterium]|nr:hypothetical protein [Gammaproteobacteria bacterium]